MKRCLQEIFSAISFGELAALVTIVEKRGSTPRGVGTAMVVRLTGRRRAPSAVARWKPVFEATRSRC